MVYSAVERRVLAPFMDIEDSTRSAITEWMETTAGRPGKTVYERLLECAARIRFELDYRMRFEPGVQTPSETLATHSGTCRDFAELMIAAARYLGCAARFVTGYVFTPNAAPGSSSPHAWAECYVPGAGWIEIDATNGLIEHGDLIPVAISLAGADLTPISGTFMGSATSQLAVGVDVIKLV
jgi:transglutaminase-like putative cysteine protease